MLCSACNDVFAGTSLRSDSPLKIRVHHPTLQSFQASVLAGCHMCSLINTSDSFLPESPFPGYSERLKNSRIEWLSLDDELLFIERKYPESGQAFPSITSEATFRLVAAKSMKPNAVVPMFVDLLTEAENATFNYVQTPITLSDSAIDVAREWYKKCTEEHRHACAGVLKNADHFFPSRVVDVGAVGENTIKVFIPNSPIREPYATLSHCWGRSQTMRLVNESVESFKKGVALDALPKTFEQAIFVTRKMGIRYLWIDSLCILQDNAEDWRAESAKMRYIYHNGALNIAAAAASSDHDGLSSTRNPACTRHIRVPITWSDPDLVAHASPGAYYIFNSGIWDREVESAPLNARGWVLQERALSPRILHFGKNQIYWQCNAAFCSEMFPEELRVVEDLWPRVPRVTSNFTADLRGLWQLRVEGGGEEWEKGLREAYARWSELINAYSATKLTRAEDKLIAVQALAETMLDATGDEYVAGLWKSRIVEDVMWRTDVDDLPKGAVVRRSEVWRAPCWSWASLDCQVEARSGYHYVGQSKCSGKCFVSEMTPFVEGLDDATTGQLRNASLQVRGLLYRNRIAFAMKTLESPLSLYRPADESTPWSFKVILDEWEEEDIHATEHPILADTLFFLIGSPIAGSIEGLILKPIVDRKDHFRRAGFFEADCG